MLRINGRDFFPPTGVNWNEKIDYGQNSNFNYVWVPFFGGCWCSAPVVLLVLLFLSGWFRLVCFCWLCLGFLWFGCCLFVLLYFLLVSLVLSLLCSSPLWRVLSVSSIIEKTKKKTKATVTWLPGSFYSILFTKHLPYLPI